MGRLAGAQGAPTRGIGFDGAAGGRMNTAHGGAMRGKLASGIVGLSVRVVKGRSGYRVNRSAGMNAD